MLLSTRPVCFLSFYLDLTGFAPFPGHQPALLLGEAVMHLGWGTVWMFCISTNSLLSGFKIQV